MYMYMCVYVYAYTCIGPYIYVRTYACMHIEL